MFPAQKQGREHSHPQLTIDRQKQMIFSVFPIFLKIAIELIKWFSF